MSDLATWVAADGRFRVVYPVTLFHEIDFDASDGYRRIPRGGIEVGGLLFGSVDGDTIRVEARRAIECEHVFGPSFRLSEKDVAGIQELIRTARTDAELSRLEAVGWFVAHTRSELLLSDSELAHFDALLPGEGRFTLLVKPEKFKPTQFTFLIRGAGGVVPRDGTAEAFILPLPGRAGTSRVVAPPGVENEPPAEPVIAPAAPDTLIAPAAPDVVTPRPVEKVQTSVPEPISVPPPAAVVEPVFEHPLPAPPPIPEQASAPAPRVSPPAPEFDPRADLSLRPRRRRTDVQEKQEHARVLRHEAPRSKTPLVALIVAVVVGCALGYWVHTQMPPELLSVTLDQKDGHYLISWPSDQTRDTDTVLMRVNDGEPTAIPFADRMAGQTQIPIPDSNQIKVEIIARHKFRDSRGIVRYVH